MSRIKLGASVLAMLAALIVCGIATSAASAEFTLTTKACSGGTSINLCYENAAKEKLEFSGTEEFELLAGEAQDIEFLSALGGLNIEITCEHAQVTHEGKADGLILQPEPLVKNTTLEYVLTFKGCKLNGTAGEKCEIPAEEPTFPLVGETEEGSDEFLLNKPKTPGKFITIKFKNKGEVKCPVTIAGERSVTGEVLCFVREPLSAKSEHLLECIPTEGQAGKLFFASSENAATFLIDTNVFLLGIKETDPWLISNEA
jgi:hypothetical protein